MKKTYFLFLILIIPYLFFGCKNKLNETMQEKISEVRYNLFAVKTDEIDVKFTSGFRENPYVLNGKSENKKEFGILTVKFLNENFDKTTLPSFVITISDMDFDGELELNPFDQTYVQDIETFVMDDLPSISLTISWQNFSFSGELKNVSKNFTCNHSNALNIFVNEFKKEILSLQKEGKDFEVYIKIINDPSFEIDKDYFYVCLISNAGDSFSIIIDPYSSQILAKNQSKNQVIL